MKVIDISSITAPGMEFTKFQGFQHDAGVSFFVVRNSPGKGPVKHRHPYEEVFVVLDGIVEMIVNGEPHMVQAEKIVIVPANTWHEFKNRGDEPVLMVNIHPAAKMIQEDWV